MVCAKGAEVAAAPKLRVQFLRFQNFFENLCLYNYAYITMLFLKTSWFGWL